MTDSGSVGLQMFRLGTIPASVTPPRSWRRAAWFTVLASVAALVGLVVAGALLVGPSREHGRISAFPYIPDGPPRATIPDTTTSSPATATAPPPSDPTVAPAVGPTADSVAGSVGRATGPTVEPTTAPSVPATPVPALPPSTVPSSGAPVTDPAPATPTPTTGAPVTAPTRLVDLTTGMLLAAWALFDPSNPDG